MLTSKLSNPDLDEPPQARTGHGIASVIARLNEQISRKDVSSMDGPDEEPADREATSTAPRPREP